MNQDNEHIEQSSPTWPPKAGACYKNGWRQLWTHVLELLLIIIISSVIILSNFKFYDTA